MKRILLNKYIISIIIFYVFWLWGLPLVITSIIPLVCQGISERTECNLQVQNPKFHLNIIPTARFSADKIVIKNSDVNTEINKPSVTVRILPLLSGRVHVNNFYSSNIDIYLKLKDNVKLDKNFVNELDNLKFKCNKIQIDKFSFALQQKGVDKPVVYTADGTIYQNNGRFFKLFTNSRVNIKNTTSEMNVDLYLPKNNNIEKSVVNINISNYLI